MSGHTPRMTGQQKAGQVCTYTLDGVGNLKTMWEGGSFPRTFTWGAADRLVTMVEGASLTTYAWTGYGALESEIAGNKATTYAYSGQDQLVLVTPPTGFKSTYTFEGDGLRRTAQEGNVLPTTMVWDGSDYLLLRGPTSDQVVLSLESEIVHCGGKDLLTDPLGTLVKEISPGASLSPLFQFYPYGSPILGPTSRTTNPFRFVGAYGYYTDSLDRDYIRARELYKSLGRWMQVDALWSEQPAYGYTGENPTSYVDPSGAFRVKTPGCPGVPGSSIKIIPEPGDWTGISSGVGDTRGRPGVISGRDAIIQTGQTGDCIAVNGGFYWPQFPRKGDDVQPVGGVVDCRGKPSGGGHRGSRFGRIRIIPVNTGHGFTHGRPDRARGDKGGKNRRTGACVNKDGTIRFIIIVPIGGITFDDLRKCITRQCPGGTFVNLDSGGSSQVIERKGGKFGSLKGGPREVQNWIVICD